MKRTGNIYQQICSIENLQAADQKARKRKAKQRGVIDHDRNRETNILALHEMLVNQTFKTSDYTHFKLCDPKPREISRLPYFPDRIVHHAIMNVLEPVFTAMFTADTYSCIKGKGIHAAKRALGNALKDKKGTQYCLKLDITQFYPSIDHDILKALLRRKIKDRDLLQLLDGIIDSAPGVPIGNYLSQYFANFYLSYFDHWLKEQLGVRYYFRYADDMVILSSDKQYLHGLRELISNYLDTELRLQMKPNYQVFPVEARGIDFLGYVHYHGYSRLRKRNKQSFARAVRKSKNRQSIMAYHGWAIHCNSKNLIKKLNLNEVIQRFQHPGAGDRLRGRQDQDRKNIERADHSPRFQNSKRQFQRRAAGPADRIQRREARDIHRLEKPDRDDQASAERRGV